jgi:hypothetical protein
MGFKYFFFLHYGKVEFYRLHRDEKVGVSTASLAKKKHKWLGSKFFFLLFSIEGAAIIFTKKKKIFTILGNFFGSNKSRILFIK